jgi:hypothetical protein
MLKDLKTFLKSYKEKRQRMRFQLWQDLEYIYQKTDLPPKFERRLMQLRKEFCETIS